jgi:hypothetical protein
MGGADDAGAELCGGSLPNCCESLRARRGESQLFVETGELAWLACAGK